MPGRKPSRRQATAPEALRFQLIFSFGLIAGVIIILVMFLGGIIAGERR
jgi:hypothetical protein